MRDIVFFIIISLIWPVEYILYWLEGPTRLVYNIECLLWTLGLRIFVGAFILMILKLWNFALIYFLHRWNHLTWFLVGYPLESLVFSFNFLLNWRKLLFWLFLEHFECRCIMSNRSMHKSIGCCIHIMARILHLIIRCYIIRYWPFSLWVFTTQWYYKWIKDSYIEDC